MQCKFHLKAKYQIKMCILFFILNIHHIQRWKTWERLWGKKLTINKNIGTKNKINSEYFFHNLWDSLVFFSSQKMTRVEKKYQILSTNSESTFSLCCEREGHSAFPSRQHIKDKESYQIWTRDHNASLSPSCLLSNEDILSDPTLLCVALTLPIRPLQLS